MTELRKNEFIDLLEMNELLYIDEKTFIKTDIPKLGNAHYYPKANRMQINKGNVWHDDGYNFIKNHLKKVTEKLYTSSQVSEYSNYVQMHNSCNKNIPAKTPQEFFEQLKK
jgi:uncharacterized short protein YbdD (DUF466 family)